MRDKFCLVEESWNKIIWQLGSQMIAKLKAQLINVTNSKISYFCVRVVYL
jgi:hypothetical protein